MTYTNPFLAGDEFYLSIDVAKDGSFRGTWGQYFCMSSIAAQGVAIVSRSRSGSDGVTGKFGPGNQGVINLVKLGRSTFTWTAPAADELAIDLPQHWQGEDEAILYRARMTRDGKQKPAAGSSAAKDHGPPLSAVVLYREFKQNQDAALKKYGGTTQMLEGKRGTRIDLSDGSVAIHIPDGYSRQGAGAAVFGSAAGRRDRGRREVSLQVQSGDLRLSIPQHGQLHHRA